METYIIEERTYKMIDELQGLCQQVGISNQAAEEEVVTTVFLYKFLNDKFMHNMKKFADEVGVSVDDVIANKDDLMDAFYLYNAKDVAFAYEDTIQYLANMVGQDDFYKQFDEVLVRIANYPKNSTYAITSDEETRIPLFTPISDKIPRSKAANFAKTIFAIITKDKFNFEDAFDCGFDFYAAVFEYMVKNYNVASGAYAEYYTPQQICKIISIILAAIIGKKQAIEIYDCCAGTGSLVLNMANQMGKTAGMNNAVIYTQDVSVKSVRLMRLNMILNGYQESLGNIAIDDTFENPMHFAVREDPSSGLKKFQCIVINPPFNVDFSSSRDRIDQKWADTGRFFAGIPNVPNKDKGKMPIYLLAIQHAMYSMADDGVAAIVVPTGFLTAKNSIAMEIRKKMIEEKMLVGVISMPSQFFANTGTNVSILFLKKQSKYESAILVDASKLGEKVSVGKNKRTVLRENEILQITDTFIDCKEIEDFSVLVPFETMKEKNYSFSAGQYFDVKIEYVDITAEEFQQRMDEYTANLSQLFRKGKELEDSIMKQMGGLKYE